MWIEMKVDGGANKPNEYSSLTNNHRKPFAFNSRPTSVSSSHSSLGGGRRSPCSSSRGSSDSHTQGSNSNSNRNEMKNALTVTRSDQQTHYIFRVFPLFLHPWKSKGCKKSSLLHEQGSLWCAMGSVCFLH